MAIPITVRCECGETHSVDLGDTVDCTCGRRYDTSALRPESFAHIRVRQARMRLYMQLGIVFIGLSVVVAAVSWGVKGVLIALPLAGLLWFLFFGKWYRTRWLHDSSQQAPLQLEATDR
jgi:hypothetical protein